MVSAVSCSICSNGHGQDEMHIAKYKCPTCFIPYCSLVCYKTHKQTPCLETVSMENCQEPPTTIPLADISHLDYQVSIQDWMKVDDKDILQRSQYEQLASNHKFRQSLQDPTIKKLIQHLSSLENRQEFDKLVQESIEHHPGFVHFVDCLRHALDMP